MVNFDLTSTVLLVCLLHFLPAQFGSCGRKQSTVLVSEEGDVVVEDVSDDFHMASFDYCKRYIPGDQGVQRMTPPLFPC